MLNYTNNKVKVKEKTLVQIKMRLFKKLLIKDVLKS